jgi:hypothetical protein
MAKLSAHGHEIGRIEGPVKTLAYMSDGAVLINRGDGWKVKVAPRKVDIKAYFEKAKRAYSEYGSSHPAWSALVDKLMGLGLGLHDRSRLALYVQMMPADPDGVYSESQDYPGMRIDVGVQDCVELCRLWREAEVEKNGRAPTAG